MKKYINERFGEERALYGEKNILLDSCAIDGEEDGESALKECVGVECVETLFNLRYPLWHDCGVVLRGCRMTELCRAALWYTHHARLEHCTLGGIKALRECSHVKIDDCKVVSPEFGWRSCDLDIRSSSFEGEYFLFEVKRLYANRLNLNGKYSFQYVEDALLEECVLNTKDAFWHSKNVTLRNCVVSGEYLAWYSEGLTLENCIITGTQPLCYCKNLRLVNCTMVGCDLSFEKSDVYATVIGCIDSVKNIASGYVCAGRIGEIISEHENPDVTITTFADGE